MAASRRFTCGRFASLLLLGWLCIGAGCQNERAATPETASAVAPGKGSEPGAAAGSVPDFVAQPEAAEPSTPPGAAPANALAAAESRPPATVPLGDLVEQVDDAVVFITALDALGESAGIGTGCLISDDGLVATNFHVLEEAATAYVQFRDGAKHEVAGWRAVDRKRDLVVLELKDTPEHLEWFRLQEPAGLRQGDELVAIGHPGEFRFTVTSGIVSALRTTKELPEIYQTGLHLTADTLWVQTNAAISGGSSGGPLLNRQGELVAINTWVANGQNLGFAIHVQHLVDLAGGLAEVSRPLPLPGTKVIADEKVARLLLDYQKELQVLISNMRAAESEEEAKQIAERQNPIPIYLTKLRELAELRRGEPAALEALLSACGIARDRSRKSVEELHAVLERLREDHWDHERLQEASVALAGAPPTSEILAFQRDLLARSPVREVRGVACYCLAASLLKSDPEGRRHAPDVIELLRRVVEEYSDVEIDEVPLLKMAEPQLFALENLAVGRVAPNIEGEDFEGKRFELADYRGQVVVVDFWADWCPHCRVMYPHERAMVKRFEDRPFALLGVNGDQRERAEAVIRSGAVTWRSWADGPAGKIAEQWQVSSIPTIYVLDGEGVIRYRDLRGEELEQAVEHLLDEPLLALPQDLVASGAPWKYLYGGSPPPEQWSSPAFDDAAWSTGASPLGYGLGREATRLSYGEDPGAKPITAYFRTSFQLPDPGAVDALILGLKADDGAAVYLNGHEAARVRLAPGAGADALADRPSDDPGEELFVLDPKWLSPGVNVLAVEVHQESPASGDLWFDLSLSTRLPDLTPIARANSPLTRIAFCERASQLEPLAARTTPTLQGWLKDENAAVRAAALAALLQVGGESARASVPEARDEDEESQRRQLAQDLNYRAWGAVKQADAAPHQYQRGLRQAQAAAALQPDDGAILNTLAVAQYRVGDNEAAIESLVRSSQLLGENPHDCALEAMARHRLGQREEAHKALQKAKDLVDADLNAAKWPEYAEVREFIGEAELLLEGSSSARPGR